MQSLVRRLARKSTPNSLVPWGLDAHPLEGLLKPGHNDVGEIVEYHITDIGADNNNDVVLTRESHNLAQQHGASRPTPGGQLVTLCDGVIVAISESRAEQPFTIGDAFFTWLWTDRRIGGAIDVHELGPAQVGQFDPAAPEHRLLRFALVNAIGAKVGAPTLMGWLTCAASAQQIVCTDIVNAAASNPTRIPWRPCLGS